jgi:tetratricopeptide (TPR) repeat protein
MNVRDSIDRANEHSCRGEYDLAIAEYDEVLRRDPKNALALYQRGYCRYVRRELDQALADFLRAMRAGPSVLDEYRIYIGRVVGEVDLDPEVESLLHKYGFSFSIYCGRAERHQAAARFDQAIAAYDEALRFCRQAPTSSFTRGYLMYRRGNCLLRKGNSAAAVADYDAALALGYTGYGDCVVNARTLAVERQ